MLWEAWRNLTKNGNSYTVAIPRAILMKMALLRGEELRLVYDDETEMLHISRAKPKAQGIVSLGVRRAVEQVQR